jgi:hypothetical protein
VRLLALHIQTVAIVTKPITASSLFAFPFGYVAPRRTRAVIVVDAVIFRFLGFVNGIERIYFGHRGFPFGYGFSERLRLLGRFRHSLGNPVFMGRSSYFPYPSWPNTLRFYMTYIV